MQFKLGLASVSFRKNTPLEILEAMRCAGLSYIEWGSDVHAPADDGENLKALASLSESYGVKCSSYGSYFKLGVDSEEKIFDYIRAAKILGTDIIRIWCGDKNSGLYSPDERTLLFEKCKRLADIAKKENVFFCFECHENTFTDSAAGALSLMNSVRSDNIGMYWQPNLSFDENMKYAKEVSPYTKVLHVFNRKEKKAEPLEKGAADWKEYLSNFSGQYLLLEFMPDGNLSSLSREAKTMVKIIRNLESGMRNGEFS